jgi:hypothetical protein
MSRKKNNSLMDVSQNGFGLAKFAILSTSVTLLSAMMAFLYLSAKDVVAERRVVGGVEPVAQAVETFDRSREVLTTTFVEVAMGRVNDPWAGFSVIENRGLAPKIPTLGAAVFLQEENGRVSVDFDGDGSVDLFAYDLDEQLLKRLSYLWRRAQDHRN